MEKYLASQVSEIRLQDQTVNRQTVAEQLPIGSVLLDFVRFSLFNFDNQQWSSDYYLVFALTAEQPDKVTMKVLGETKEIEELVELSRLQAIAYSRSSDGELVRFNGKELAIDFSQFSQVSPSVKLETIPLYCKGKINLFGDTHFVKMTIICYCTIVKAIDCKQGEAMGVGRLELPRPFTVNGF